MKLPLDVNGRRLADHLIRRWDFQEVRQTGSHIVLQSSEPAFHISIPAHKPLRLGTFADIVNEVAKRKEATVQQLLHRL